ncbi:hypothetical protein ABT234_20930 [Streptomyces sp. NPDC001586]|uniref:phage tail protein n=1 Tax=Streptomyces sp. NPDC001586 TaxID=3154387 RepID=UPI003316A06F
MALTVGELVANINADTSGIERGLSSAELQMRGFQQDAEGRLRRLDGTFANLGERMSMGFAEAERGGRRFSMSLSGITGALGGLGGAAMSVGKMAAMFGAAAPAAAGMAATIGAIAPAAGVAVTGLFAMQLATQAVKIGMQGVGDAVGAAMDPSDPEAYAEALKKLAPNAQAFVKEVRALQPELKGLQQGVQNALFEDLDQTLRDMGKSTLPVLKTHLVEAATTMRFMAQGVGDAAVRLSENGTLGKALHGANEGLANLSAAPGQVVQALVQIGAAAAPSFARLTAAARDGLGSLSGKLDKAFESGAMQTAIEKAIGLIKQIGEVAGNVFSILGSVFNAAQTSGGGMLGVLRDVSGALATAFASPGVQDGLKAIFETMATLGKTIAPLFAQALRAIAPVFTALGPPIQRLIQTIGPILGQVIGALGPVLATAATAVGALLDAVSPLLPVIGSLITGLLPALTPLLTLVAGIFQRLAPLVAQLAGILMSALAPILAALLPALTPIVDALLVLVDAVMPIVSAQMTAFAPLVAQLAGMFAQLMVALGPVIAQLILLVADVLTKMTPMLTTVIGFVAQLAGVFANELGTVIQTVVLPAFQAIAALLSGDFSGAWNAAKAMVSGIIDSWIRIFRDLPAKAGEALSGLAAAIWARVSEAGGRMVDSIKQKRDEAMDRLRELPGQAKSALGNLGSMLYDSGASLVRGFIDGIKSMIADVKSAASKVVSGARDFFPFSPAKEGPFSGKGWTLYSGQALAQGFADGIASQSGLVGGAINSMMAAGALPGMALAGAGAGGMAGGGGRLIVEVTGPDGMKGIIRRIVQVDGRGSVITAFE